MTTWRKPVYVWDDPLIDDVLTETLPALPDPFLESTAGHHFTILSFGGPLTRTTSGQR
jgi:hypothetical protein